MGSQGAMRPLEARFDQLPDMTPVAPYPGMTSRIQTLCRSVTSARSSLELWDIISATGRRIQIPRSKDGVPLCSAAVACALANLRDTVNGTCTAFAWDEDGLWHLNASTDGYAHWHPVASVQSEFGIIAAEHRSDIEEYVRHAVMAEPRVRIVRGVKFADRGFCRDEDVVNNHTITVYPDHPMWNRPWALDMGGITYDKARVDRFRRQAVAVVYPEAVEALARMVAAPVCQPYMHGIALLSGKGGKGKGSVLNAMTGLYGELAKPFSMAGAVSFALGHPDPKVAPRITDQLTDYGIELLDKMMTCAPLDDGMPIDARVPAQDVICKSEHEKREQRNMMGSASMLKRDIRGDKTPKQMVYIKDPARFRPFAEHWLAEQAAIAAEDEARRARDEADEEYARHILMEVPPFESVPGVAAQIEILREVDDLEGTLITPTPSQWQGKGITAKWRDDATIRHDLRFCDLSDLPDRCGLSLAEDVLILDLDAADSDDPSSMDGTASLMRIPGMTRGMLDTLVMRSPHGAHVCYRLPADLVGRVKASTHVGGTKIDLRPGGRSYVIAPGSQWHDEGGDHAYPGVIRAPMPDDAGRRILPMLPAPIRKWIEVQNAIEPDRASALVPSTSRPAPDSPGLGRRLIPRRCPPRPRWGRARRTARCVTARIGSR